MLVCFGKWHWWKILAFDEDIWGVMVIYDDYKHFMPQELPESLPHSQLQTSPSFFTLSSFWFVLPAFLFATVFWVFLPLTFMPVFICQCCTMCHMLKLLCPFQLVYVSASLAQAWQWWRWMLGLSFIRFCAERSETWHRLLAVSASEMPFKEWLFELL